MGFIKRRLRISLSSHLRSITGIYHPSSYCSVAYNNLQITLTSLKPGTGYIYLNGILKSNDNKAIVLFIVIVASNGSLSTGEPYIFTQEQNFDKVPSTIQKEFNTYSSVENLDTEEPEEIDGGSQSVKKEKIDEIFSKFNAEENILPKIFIAFCIKKNKWCINYTNDTEVKNDSDFILYDKTYDGLFDCINASFDLLTKNRTTKQKIVIITGGSTGSSKLNPNSKVNRNNRLYNSITIKPASYTILDFQNNYIYVDTSETLVESNITYNIHSFIDMERSTEHVTICNLTILGKPDYGIFIAQGFNILIKNFHIQIAKGEFKSCFEGIRIQGQANASWNVEPFRWSHDIYLDNCSFNGVEYHGFETFNVHDIYATKIKATDVGGCGILLNCTYNVWIYQVIATRCCPKATYAATRFANDAGPNINIHYVYGEACGNGVFLVSSCNGITIDKVNLLNIHSTPVYVSGSGGLNIKSGKILSNGGEIKYTKYNGETDKVNSYTGFAIFLVAGSSGQFMPQWNNIFENIKIEGYTTGYAERYKMSANYNIYNNIDTTKCKNEKSAENAGTGTDEDIGFNFCIINGEKGIGYDKITGNKIISGNYTYALADDSESYVIMEYNGDEENIIIPNEYDGKTISRIGSFAFYEKDSIKTLVVNSNIKSIGGLCFATCKNLEKIIFTNGGNCDVGHCAFRGCGKLVSIDLSGVSKLRASCFALCTGLTKVICPKNVVYFGANIFFNCDIELIIECDNRDLITVEPYAFYYMGRKSSIAFTSLAEPKTETLAIIPAASNAANTYYYHSHSYLEQNVYKPGVWCKYYSHIVIPLTFSA